MNVKRRQIEMGVSYIADNGRHWDVQGEQQDGEWVLCEGDNSVACGFYEVTDGIVCFYKQDGFVVGEVALGDEGAWAAFARDVLK